MKLIKRILHLLDTEAIVELKHIKDCGTCAPGDCIVIRKTLCERSKVSTLIHECVHWLYPELSEEVVLIIEEILFNNLTEEEYGHLLYHLTEHWD